jgi:hypothetical protein
MNRNEQAQAHKAVAQNLLQKVESDPLVGTKTEPHLGLPNNIAGI